MGDNWREKRVRNWREKEDNGKWLDRKWTLIYSLKSIATYVIWGW
jgi:hypothetical protein